MEKKKLAMLVITITFLIIIAFFFVYIFLSSQIGETNSENKIFIYDSFVASITLFLSGFLILLTVLIVIGGYVFYKNIDELKKSVTDELSKDFDKNSKRIIKKTLEDNDYDKKIENISGQIDLLGQNIDDLRSKTVKVPFKLAEKGEEKNIFD